MNHDQLNRSIQQLLEGVINPCELQLLEHELARNPQARELYIDLAEIHSFLDNSEPVSSLQNNIVPMERIVRRQKRRNLRIALSVAAAVVILGTAVMQLFFVVAPVERLQFTSAPGSQFEITHLPSDEVAPKGMILLAGSTLDLHQGTVELDFESGVRSIVMAPAQLTLNDSGELDLSLGSAWFHVPEEAVGFTVNTGELEIVDLGTEFGVISSPEKPDQVHVFTGKVAVSTLATPSTITLTADHALQVSDSGQLETIDVSYTSFSEELPSSLPYLHWSFDGNGAEQFVVSGNLPSAEDIFTEVGSNTQPQFTTDTGKFGNALALTGLNTIQTSWYGTSGNAPRTVAFWIKLPPGKSINSSILGWGKRDNENIYSSTKDFYIFSKNKPSEDTNEETVTGLSLGGHWVESFTNIADNQWHHVAYVYTGKDLYDEGPEILCYIDGETEELSVHSYREVVSNGLNDLVKTAGEDSGGSPVWMFGHHWDWKSDQNVKRSLDELYIFQGALDQHRIRRLYETNSIGR